MSIELLNNNGIQYIGENKALLAKERTLIVVGVARGGTSLIAGTLDHLGVFTGDKSRQPVFEDVHLSLPLEKNDFSTAQSIIDQYNIKEVWAFKRPSAINYLEQLDKLCRNPIYLIVFKDIFSVSNRNSISMKTDVVSGLKKAHEDYAKILKFIGNNNPNAFLLSYEKIIGNKEFFVETMIDLIGKEQISPEQKESALAFIEPNPKNYLDASRITKSIGRVGSVEKTRIIGWGKYLHSNKPATVELYINDQLIATKVAQDFRQNAFDKKIHPTGNCGYLFSLQDSPLKNGDKVSVKLTDDVVFLNNSNYICEEGK